MIKVILDSELYCDICGGQDYPIVSYDREDLDDPAEWPLQICYRCACVAVGMVAQARCKERGERVTLDEIEDHLNG